MMMNIKNNSYVFFCFLRIKLNQISFNVTIQYEHTVCNFTQIGKECRVDNSIQLVPIYANNLAPMGLMLFYKGNETKIIFRNLILKQTEEEEEKVRQNKLKSWFYKKKVEY